MYWFNNNFNNLTKSILFPGGGGGSGDHYAAPAHGIPSPSDSPSPDSNSHRPYTPPEDNRAARSRADAEDYAAMERDGLRRRARDYDTPQDRDRDDDPGRPRENPADRPKPKEKEKPIPEIFKKVPIFPMGKDKPKPVAK